MADFTCALATGVVHSRAVSRAPRTVSGGRPLGLYDLASDPGERKDLLDDKAKASEALERFKGFRRTLREVRVKPE